MTRHALITGGAGFIGSHLADELLAHGYRVRAIDSLVAQVHGERADRPSYLHGEVELVVGDLRDAEALGRALDGVDLVFHLAAAVGVAQSMYRVADYVSANDLGTATLLEALVARPVERLVVASSMSVYGEGLYRDASGREVTDAGRSSAQLAEARWEPCDERGEPLTPLPTPERKPPSLESIYALSKYDQERMALLVGQAYGIPAVALRFFNVYGTRQSLSNPYTGVLAIFASRLLNGRAPCVFEDGLQQRDFVHVRDVARACRLAAEVETALGPFNVASGRPRTIVEIGERLARALGRELPPVITGRYRAGDIRHCLADTARAERLLGFRAEVELDDGLAELCAWLEGQPAEDRFDEMREELQLRGLQR